MRTKDKLTDQELVMAYANGDNEAFDVLLARHQSRLFAYIVKIVRNKDAADDIFQETFVKAIVTIKQGRYVDSGKFSAWLSRIAHNLVIDYFRQEKAENTVSSDDSETDMLNRREFCDGNIEDVLVDRQIRDDVRRIILALPPAQRQVLVMRYYRNMPFKEIADRTGVSIGTALGRMRYALINMRKLASENGIALTAV